MAEGLLALAAARNGHFLLESGHHGALWLDLDQLFTRPGLLQPFMATLAEQIAPYQPDGICGPLTGGAFVAQALASLLGLEFYYSHRVAPAGQAVSYHISSKVGGRLAGKRLAVVDDAINAGSAVRGTWAALQDYGANLAVVGALLLLGNTAPTWFKPTPVLAVAHLPENQIWTPAGCPLCAANMPLETVS